MFTVHSIQLHKTSRERKSKFDAEELNIAIRISKSAEAVEEASKDKEDKEHELQQVKRDIGGEIYIIYIYVRCTDSPQERSRFRDC